MVEKRKVLDAALGAALGTLDVNNITVEYTSKANKQDVKKRKTTGKTKKTRQTTYEMTQNLKGVQTLSKNTKTKPAQKAQGNKAKSNKLSVGKAAKQPVRIILLGGVNEIGKNITVIECGEDIIVVDCGLAFPDEEMLGVDIVIPDFSFLEKNKDKIRGIVLTHGHEDHIGSLPFLLKTINLPVYGTQLTLGLVEGKLREHGLLGKVKLNTINAGQTIKFGCMSVEFIHVNHSIPDAVGLAIDTPEGIIIMTGDFKIDTTPIQGGMIDLGRFAELGKKGVLALLSDSTNAERPGYTLSESKVGDSFDVIFGRSEKRRIIIATFASNIHRVQQIIDAAHRFNRKVAVSGRSMINVLTIAASLGFLTLPDGVLIDIDEIDNYPKEKIVLITTGTQGEPMSALSRMAFSDHRKVVLGPDDLIVISASPIPGNEKLVNKVINEIMKLGCEVVYEKMYEVHVSGHACQEEQKIMIGITKPKYFIPVHGEQKHLKKHAKLALEMGMKMQNIIIPDIGNIIELDSSEIKVAGNAQSGSVLVDGIGVGDVGSIVLRDRKHLAEDGIMLIVTTVDTASGKIVAGPDIVSRGFVYMRESENMIEDSKAVARRVIEDCLDKNIREWGAIKNKVRDEMSHMLYGRTKRKPMILPVIMEI